MRARCGLTDGQELASARPRRSRRRRTSWPASSTRVKRFGVVCQKQSDETFVSEPRQRLERILRRRAKEMGFVLKKTRNPGGRCPPRTIGLTKRPLSQLIFDNFIPSGCLPPRKFRDVSARRSTHTQRACLINGAERSWGGVLPYFCLALSRRPTDQPIFAKASLELGFGQYLTALIPVLPLSFLVPSVVDFPMRTPLPVGMPKGPGP